MNKQRSYSRELEVLACGLKLLPVRFFFLTQVVFKVKYNSHFQIYSFI